MKHLVTSEQKNNLLVTTTLNVIMLIKSSLSLIIVLFMHLFQESCVVALDMYNYEQSSEFQYADSLVKINET